MSDNNKQILDSNEYEAAEKAALEDSSPKYVHTFKKPFSWQDREYKKLEFDFEKLTGKDALAIEQELAMQGVSVISPTLSSAFLIRMASRASGLGTDAFEHMTIKDFNRIRSKARNFMLASEL